MIYRRNHWKIKILYHALVTAVEKNIPQDIIEAVVRGGEIEWFGKHYVRFTKRYKDGDIICVGEKKTFDTIKIFTVEKRGGYDKERSLYGV